MEINTDMKRKREDKLGRWRESNLLLEKTEDYSSNTNKSVAGNVKPQALMKILLNWQMAK